MTDIFIRSTRWSRLRRRGRHVRARPHRILRATLVVIALSAAVGGWRLLGPVGLGGGSSYALVSGTSMLPAIHPGDLVVTRQEPIYHLGEIVAYDNRQLHETVIHRIAGFDGTRFIMKGDHNGFTDPYHPAASDIVGARWYVVAGGARYLSLLRHPAFAGLLGAAVGFLAFMGDELPGARRAARGTGPRARVPAIGQI